MEGLLLFLENVRSNVYRCKAQLIYLNVCVRVELGSLKQLFGGVAAMNESKRHTQTHTHSEKLSLYLSSKEFFLIHKDLE